MKHHLLGDSAVFCMLPWVHLHVWPEGKTYPCCVADGEHPIGDLRSSTLEEIWNGEPMRRLRRNMLDDQPSPECHRCYELERAGINSHRTHKRELFLHHFPVVESTRADGSVEPMALRYLDIRFSNLCNLRCRSCGVGFSSAWAADDQLLSPGGNYPKVIRPTADPESMWRQLEPLIPGLEEIYFAGGEPILMEEHYRILRLLIDRGSVHVRLRYNTNFAQLTYKNHDVIELWKQFPDINVGASLDGMEARGEYLRKGLVWSDVVANRQRLLREAPHVGFDISFTLSLMNALHLPDFHRAWVEAGLVDGQSIFLNLLTSPNHYRVQALPSHLKARVREKFRRHIDDFLPRHEGHRHAAKQFEAALCFMDEQDLSPELETFRDLTRRLDAIRGERFEEVFPELREIMLG
jgi:radical SAM protein with 4Fe4S-binding SPASM domain